MIDKLFDAHETSCVRCRSVSVLQKEDRQPGDRWMIRGPAEYVPPVEVEVVTKRSAIPLDENEGALPPVDLMIILYLIVLQLSSVKRRHLRA